MTGDRAQVRATWRPEVLAPEAAALRRTTSELLAAVARDDPDRVLVVDEQRSLSAGETAGLAAAVQARLRDLGVGTGSVVASQLPNVWEAVVFAHAVWGLGAVLVPVPVGHRAAELTALFRATRIDAFAVPAEHRATDHPALVTAAARVAGVQVPLLVVRDAEQSFPHRGDDPDAFTAAADLDAVCMIMFTSGTTGVAKGVLHSHRTLIADAVSIAELFTMDRDRVFMPSPVAHITGLVYGVIMPLVMAGSCVLQAVWEPAHAVELIESTGCTTCVGATPFLRGLTDVYTARGTTSSLTSFVCGGADVPAGLVQRATEVMDACVVRAYGLTEMPTVTCGGPTDDLRVRSTTDGRLTGTSEARIVGAVDGVGELEVRGPELCLGYLEPEHTAATFTTDGWLRTGDLARLDGDAVTITGRSKDIIVRGGENISVREVEDLLLDHPCVDDVAVVGVADGVLGERACAVIVAAGPVGLADLGAFLLDRGIAKHKLPERLLLTDQLPRTASGKIQKFVVRDLAEQRLARGDGEFR